MKILRSALFFCLLLFSLSSAMAQSATDADILSIAEQMPEYPGGYDSLMRDINARIVYPQACIDSNIQGRVHLRFVVNTDGSISDVFAIKSAHPLLSESAATAIQGVGKFKPGMQSGKAVRVWFSCPVNFKLKEKEPDEDIAAPAKDTVYAFVDSMPEYPGGEQALRSFLSKNTKYPEKEFLYEVMGKVLTSFIIEKDGSVDSVWVVKGASPGLDAEAVRIVKMLPKFKPAMLNGKPVRIYYNLPFFFKLDHIWGYDVSGSKYTKHKTLFDYYEGGYDAFSEFIQSNMKFPELALEKRLKQVLKLLANSIKTEKLNLSMF